MFETKLSLEERIVRTEMQLAKAKDNRKRSYERASKLERKLDRLVAKRPAPQIAEAPKPAGKAGKGKPIAPQPPAAA